MDIDKHHTERVRSPHASLAQRWGTEIELVARTEVSGCCLTHRMIGGLRGFGGLEMWLNEITEFRLFPPNM
jgi:hypothetical protein